MKSILKRQHCLILERALILFISPLDSFSKDILFEEAREQDTVASEMVNDFLAAVNSGERKTMQDFILRYYDQNALKRIPLFAVVNLNLGFYYETGGMGYELLNILPSEANLISAELCNELTDSRLILKIPTSGAPLHKINRLITTELMSSSAKESQVKHLSMAELIARIQECLKVLDEDEEFSGTVLLAKNGEILFASFHGYAFFHSDGAAGREASHSGDGQGMNCHFKMFLDSGYTYVVLSNYSQPSANIVASVIDQLISSNAVQ